MGKRRKQLGGNSHQRSVAHAKGDQSLPLSVSVDPQKTRTMLEIAFSWPVRYTRTGKTILSTTFHSRLPVYFRDGELCLMPSLKVFVPKLLNGEQLKLIIGASTTVAPLKRAPKWIEISGSYDVIGEGTTQRTTLSQPVEVKP
jgi:hypothetical protein